MKKYFIISFGCQMNDHDSEFIEGILSSVGMALAPSIEDADLVVVNTCCVRGHAEERAIGRISQLNRIKKDKKDFLICVTGCLAQRDGKNLLQKLPFIDIIIGTSDLPNLPYAIDETQKSGKNITLIDGINLEHDFNLPQHRHSKFKAMITIMRGCDNFCSYCIVPYVRGREISRPASEIIDEAKKLADNGVKEILLLGQNVNSYHDGEINFPKLLEKLDAVSGVNRIRFITSHPKDASDDLFKSIADLKSVCEHLHLPAQAGNNRILNLMNRSYTREDYLDKINKLRSFVPDISITTDLMVGFPSETETEFEDTLKLAEEVMWDMAFMFIYSVREGTDAAKLNDDVPRTEKVRRMQKLIGVVEKIAAQKNKNLLGKTVDVLVETISRRAATDVLGRTRTDKTVIFKGSGNLIGKIVDVKITETSSHTLKGEMI